MKKVRNYKLLIGETAKDVEAEVEYFLAAGWQPYGNPYGWLVSVSNERTVNRHYQAIVRYEEEM